MSLGEADKLLAQRVGVNSLGLIWIFVAWVSFPQVISSHPIQPRGFSRGSLDLLRKKHWKELLRSAPPLPTLTFAPESSGHGRGEGLKDSPLRTGTSRMEAHYCSDCCQCLSPDFSRRNVWVRLGMGASHCQRDTWAVTSTASCLLVSRRGLETIGKGFALTQDCSLIAGSWATF